MVLNHSEERLAPNALPILDGDGEAVVEGLVRETNIVLGEPFDDGREGLGKVLVERGPSACRRPPGHAEKLMYVLPAMDRGVQLEVVEEKEGHLPPFEPA